MGLWDILCQDVLRVQIVHGGRIVKGSLWTCGQALWVGQSPAGRGDNPWTTLGELPTGCPDSRPLAHDAHRGSHKFLKFLGEKYWLDIFIFGLRNTFVFWKRKLISFSPRMFFRRLCNFFLLHQIIKMRI